MLNEKSFQKNLLCWISYIKKCNLCGYIYCLCRNKFKRIYIQNKTAKIEKKENHTCTFENHIVFETFIIIL